MEFLCDVHIPIKLVRFLNERGYAATHVNELSKKWYTPDSEICQVADSQNKILITKDKDFRNSFFLYQTPKKLIRIILGNISNHHMIQLVDNHLAVVAKLNGTEGFYLELGNYTSVYMLK